MKKISLFFMLFLSMLGTSTMAQTNLATTLIKVRNYLAMPDGTVGYPGTEAKANLSTAYSTYRSSTANDKLATLQTALATYLSQSVTMPQNGSSYYIGCDTPGGIYYLYLNGTALATSTANSGTNNYLWTCTVTTSGSTTNYTFQNKGNTSYYLGYKASSTSAYNFTISYAKATHFGGLPLYAVGASKYMLVKGTGNFDQADNTYDKLSTDYSSDYFFLSADTRTLKDVNMAVNSSDGEIGFPVTSYKTTLSNALSTYNSSSKTTTDLATLQTAMSTYTAATPTLPTVGKYYYINSDNSNEGAYYLYDNGGTLTAKTTDGATDNYLWLCGTNDDGEYTFQNKATGKYLSNGTTTNSTAYGFNLSSGHIRAGRLALYSSNDSKYLRLATKGGTITEGDASTTYDKYGTAYSSDFYLTEHLNTLTITTSPTTSATFKWNGISQTGTSATFTYNETSSVTDGTITCTLPTAAYTSTVTTTNGSWDGTSIASSTYAITPNIFSSTYGEKWFYINSANNSGYCLTYNSASSITSTTKTTNSASQLWCFVGNADGYKIYNQSAGNAVALNGASYNLTTGITMVTSSSASSWKLDGSNLNDDKPGYALTTIFSSKTYGLNANGQKATVLYEYGADNDGSHWTLTSATTSHALTINSSVTTTFTWNGTTTTAGTSATLAYSGTNAVSPGTISVGTTPATGYIGVFFDVNGKVVTSWDGTSDATYSYREIANIFSSSYGDKWLHVNSSRYSSTSWMYNSTSSVTATTSDAASASQMWCFVGNAAAFKIYNKAAGASYALAGTVYNSNTGVSMTAPESASTWSLNGINLSDDYAGYAFTTTVGSSTYGLNAKGSTSPHFLILYGYGTGNDGSHWTVDVLSSFTLNLTGLPTTIADTHAKIASIPFSYTTGSTTTSSTILVSKANISGNAITCYLPTGTTVSLSAPTVWLGYTFGGYNGNSSTTSISGLTINGSTSVTASFTESNADVRYTFYDGDGLSAPYRIPAITTAKNGNVLAFNDRRYCGADIGNGQVDIVGRISTDNGSTWGTDFTVMDGTGTASTFSCGFGDAAVVADRGSNTILMMAAAGNKTYGSSSYSTASGFSTASSTLCIGRIYGKLINGSWVWNPDLSNTTSTAGTPTDVTTNIYNLFGGNLAGIFFGSGRICQSRQVKVGSYYRLYAALCTRSSVSGYGGNYVVYSDDFGQTWVVLGGTASSPEASGDEPKCEELPDGSVLLSSRKSYGRYFNIFTYSSTPTSGTPAAGSWGTAIWSNDKNTITNGIAFGANSTNGEIYLVKALRKSDSKPVTLALQSVPTGSSRTDVKIYYKELLDRATDYDTPTLFGSNWDGSYLVKSGYAAYSTMTLQHNGQMGFYMEENPTAGTFDMVYVPLSIATITNNAYTEGFTRTITDAGYATLYLDYPTYIPQGVTAYYAPGNPSKSVLSLTSLTDGIIPQETAVVLKGSAASYSFIECSEAASKPSANLLVGTMTDASITGSSSVWYYGLNYKTTNNVKNVGFFIPAGADTPNSSFTMKATKAYLRLTSAPSSVNGYTVSFDEGDDTGIAQPTLPAGGQNVIYDLQGRRVASPTEKGIYIVNGKKVVLK